MANDIKGDLYKTRYITQYHLSRAIPWEIEVD